MSRYEVDHPLNSFSATTEDQSKATEEKLIYFSDIVMGIDKHPLHHLNTLPFPGDLPKPEAKPIDEKVLIELTTAIVNPDLEAFLTLAGLPGIEPETQKYQHIRNQRQGQYHTEMPKLEILKEILPIIQSYVRKTMYSRLVANYSRWLGKTIPTQQPQHSPFDLYCLAIKNKDPKVKKTKHFADPEKFEKFKRTVNSFSTSAHELAPQIEALEKIYKEQGLEAYTEKLKANRSLVNFFLDLFNAYAHFRLVGAELLVHFEDSEQVELAAILNDEFNSEQSVTDTDEKQNSFHEEMKSASLSSTQLIIAVSQPSHHIIPIPSEKENTESRKSIISSLIAQRTLIELLWHAYKELEKSFGSVAQLTKAQTADFTIYNQRKKNIETKYRAGARRYLLQSGKATVDNVEAIIDQYQHSGISEQLNLLTLQHGDLRLPILHLAVFRYQQTQHENHLQIVSALFEDGCSLAIKYEEANALDYAQIEQIPIPWLRAMSSATVPRDPMSKQALKLIKMRVAEWVQVEAPMWLVPWLQKYKVMKAIYDFFVNPARKETESVQIVLGITAIRILNEQNQYPQIAQETVARITTEKHLFFNPPSPRPRIKHSSTTRTNDSTDIPLLAHNEPKRYDGTDADNSNKWTLQS